MLTNDPSPAIIGSKSASKSTNLPRKADFNMAKLVKLREAHASFLEFLKSRKRAHATILAYGKDIDQLVSYLENAKVAVLSDVKRENIENFLSSLSKENYTAKSISRKLNSIKTFYRYCKANEFISEDPSILISHPKYETKPPRILSKLEYRALRDACRDDARISAIVELLLQTGIRIGELANIRLEDVKANSLFIQAQEGHNERDIPLNKSAKTALDKYISIRPKTTESILFVTKTGRPLLVRNIRTAIDRYFRIAGIKDAKVNDLRHTWIAHHLIAGTSLVVVSKLAGHKRLSTTEKYLDLIKGQASENVKLEEL